MRRRNGTPASPRPSNSIEAGSGVVVGGPIGIPCEIAKLPFDPGRDPCRACTSPEVGAPVIPVTSNVKVYMPLLVPPVIVIPLPVWKQMNGRFPVPHWFTFPGPTRAQPLVFALVVTLALVASLPALEN